MQLSLFSAEICSLLYFSAFLALHLPFKRQSMNDSYTTFPGAISFAQAGGIWPQSDDRKAHFQMS